MNESIDEKKVPSSYLDNLDSTLSNTAINYIKKHWVNIHKDTFMKMTHTTKEGECFLPWLGP